MWLGQNNKSFFFNNLLIHRGLTAFYTNHIQQVISTNVFTSRTAFLKLLHFFDVTSLKRILSSIFTEAYLKPLNCVFRSPLDGWSVRMVRSSSQKTTHHILLIYNNKKRNKLFYLFKRIILIEFSSKFNFVYICLQTYSTNSSKRTFL